MGLYIFSSFRHFPYFSTTSQSWT